MQAIFEGQAALAPHLQSGKVRALAIPGATRNPALPDVPTAAEAERGAGGGALGARLARNAPQGLEPAGNSPPQFAAYIASEIERRAAVVKASGAKVD